MHMDEYFRDMVSRIRSTARDMKRCIGLPVDVNVEDGGGYVTIVCGGEILIADCTEYVEGSVQDMLSGMKFYKKIMKKEKRNV